MDYLNGACRDDRKYQTSLILKVKIIANFDYYKHVIEFTKEYLLLRFYHFNDRDIQVGAIVSGVDCYWTGKCICTVPCRRYSRSIKLFHQCQQVIKQLAMINGLGRLVIFLPSRVLFACREAITIVLHPIIDEQRKNIP